MARCPVSEDLRFLMYHLSLHPCSIESASFDDHAAHFEKKRYCQVQGPGLLNTDVCEGQIHPPGSTIVVDPLFSRFSYGLKNVDTRVASPSLVASLSQVDDDFEGAENVRFLKQSYRIYSRFEFHQVGEQTFMLGRQEYVEEYKDHGATIMDWTNLTAEDCDMAFCMPTVLNCFHRSDIGDPYYHQLRRVTIFVHQWNRALLRRPDGPRPLQPHYLLLLDLQHRPSARSGREILVRRQGERLEGKIIDFHALRSGNFEIQYCFTRQESHSIQFLDLADLESPGVEFRNEVAKDDVIDETAVVF